MFRFVKRLLALLALLGATALFVVFSISNRDLVAVKFFAFASPVEMPIFILAIGFLLLGALLATLFTASSLFYTRLKRIGQDRRIRALENELSGFRLEHTDVHPR